MKHIVGYENSCTVHFYCLLSSELCTFILKSLFFLCSIKEAVYGSGKEVFHQKKEENDTETNVSSSCIDYGISRLSVNKR